MSEALFLEEVGDDGVAWLTLTRSEVHNAFNDTLISALTRSLESLQDDERVRVVVLGAKGPSFSAGADLNWMKRMAGYSEEENLADARALARLLQVLDGLKQPTVAMIQGPAFGGGVGLIACCDIAIAAESAHFALTEVRLGLIPAVISPYVLAAIGERAARRYMLSAERMTAREAQAIGLIHEVVPDEQLQARTDRVLKALLTCGPEAQAEAKALIFAVAGKPRGEAVIEDTARRIARVRAGAEGKEGLAAFLEKRKPKWLDG
ncbi:MAG: enoyl-CoA hydratase/isomerase family protein [Pseudomonadota bacterium]